MAITLNGMLRIGLSAQKVTAPTRKPDPEIALPKALVQKREQNIQLNGFVKTGDRACLSQGLENAAYLQHLALYVFCRIKKAVHNLPQHDLPPSKRSRRLQLLCGLKDAAGEFNEIPKCFGETAFDFIAGQHVFKKLAVAARQRVTQ